jgi:hypothetical protein
MLICCSGYTKKDGKIFIRSSNEAFVGVNYFELKDADYETFDEIDHNINIDLAKDKNHVFIGAEVIKGADSQTFEQINEYYWKDKGSVYLLEFDADECKIEFADVGSFKKLDNNYWAKDKNNIYYGLKKLDIKNVESFIAIDENWGKDDKTYYWQNFELNNFDYSTANIISLHYIKDKNNVFYENQLVVGCNPLTFKTVGVGSFGHDNKYMYSGTKNEGVITDVYRKMYITKK